MRGQKGAALIEFALIALTIYLLLAGGIELGRMVFVSQTLQDAARLAARELAVTPVAPDATFGDGLAALTANGFWDRRFLVLDISACAPDEDLKPILQAMPPLNAALSTLLISEVTNQGADGRRLLRYPGALLLTGAPYAAVACAAPAPDLTVWIPLVSTDVHTGAQTITRWADVFEEMKTDVFKFSPPGKGLAAVIVNYPFQSPMLSLFRRDPADPLKKNLGDVIVANAPSGPPGPGAPASTDCANYPTYCGSEGLGQQYALNNTVRPYRNLLVGQAIFRREVVE